MFGEVSVCSCTGELSSYLHCWHCFNHQFKGLVSNLDTTLYLMLQVVWNPGPGYVCTAPSTMCQKTAQNQGLLSILFVTILVCNPYSILGHKYLTNIPIELLRNL